MTNATNKEVVTRYLDFLNAGHYDDAVSLFSEDCIWNIPASIPGGGKKSKAEFCQVLKDIMGLFVSQPQYHIVSTTSEDNRISVELWAEGDVKNGSRYENAYNILFEVDNGQITQVREYVDTYYAVKTVFPN